MAVILQILLNSCSSLKFIEDDQSLIRESTVVLEDPNSLEYQSQLKFELESIQRQTPPNRFLGVPRDLYYFRNTQEGDTSKWNKFVLNNIANRPAILDSLEIKQGAIDMEQFLKNKRGYYNAKVTSEINTTGQITRVKYLVSTNERYRVNEVSYRSNNNEVHSIINEDPRKRLIQSGDPIDATLFDEEKQRIFQELQNRGYANFLSDNIKIKADSTIGNFKMDVLFDINMRDNPEGFQKYSIGTINVFTDYAQDQAYPNIPAVVLNGKNYYSIDKDFVVRPRAIDKHVFLKAGEVYSRDDHYKTIRKLSEFSTYKFVKLTPNNDVRNDSIINYNVFLTPHKFRWISDIGSDAFYATINLERQQLFGFSLNGSLINRNAFGGSERYSLSGEAGAEFQILNGFRLNSVRFGIQNNLLIPKQVDYMGIFGLIYGITKDKNDRRNTHEVATKTNVNVGFNYQDVFEQYIIRSASASIAYNYRPNENWNITLKPSGVNLFDYSIREGFQQTLDTIPLLENSFRNNFFSGIFFKEFSAIYTKPENYRGISYAVYMNLELSGGEIFLANKLYNVFAKNDKNFRLSNEIDFTNFFKVEIDGRIYKKLTTTSALATRFNIGYSSPYGDDITVPFIKQFFVGGPNSIRAWSSRELGAGGYSELLENPISGQRFYQAGDIKIEFNTEYRTDLFWIIEGAFFLDGGNVWLKREDPDRPNSSLNADFLNQIALGWGWGLRFDFTYFNLRFDFAYILKNPYPSVLGNYFRSPIGQGILGNAHIAVNYPF